MDIADVWSTLGHQGLIAANSAEEITNKNVYAFEPFADSFKLLNKNIEDNNIEKICFRDL